MPVDVYRNGKLTLNTKRAFVLQVYRHFWKVHVLRAPWADLLEERELPVPRLCFAQKRLLCEGGSFSFGIDS